METIDSPSRGGPRFLPVKLPLLTSEVARELLEAVKANHGYVTISLDLCYTRPQNYKIERGELVLEHGILPIELLEEVVEDERSIYAYSDGTLFKVERRARRFYKLVKTKWGDPPTIEIDGIHMHRVLNISPYKDAENKVRLLKRIKGAKVLDTCMGLGYTAIAALKAGAREVVTVEKDENVYEIARMNPWSSGLSSPKVETVLCDVTEYVKEVADETFDTVIHDPPTLALAGELYGLEFYRELARVLRKGGELVHYVGFPGHMSGRRIYAGVMRRLREVGFVVTWREEEGVVYGRKEVT